jgi:hypothetical protein
MKLSYVMLPLLFAVALPSMADEIGPSSSGSPSKFIDTGGNLRLAPTTPSVQAQPIAPTRRFQHPLEPPPPMQPPTLAEPAHPTNQPPVSNVPMQSGAGAAVNSMPPAVNATQGVPVTGAPPVVIMQPAAPSQTEALPQVTVAPRANQGANPTGQAVPPTTVVLPSPPPPATDMNGQPLNTTNR